MKNRGTTEFQTGNKKREVAMLKSVETWAYFPTSDQVSSHRQSSFQSHVSNFLQYENLVKAFKKS